MMTKKIDLMIVGAPKAGTTSLLRYLAAHPEITTHRQAEFPYFLDENTFSEGYEKTVNRFFGENLRSVLAAKHVRLMYSDKAVARLHEHNPKVQVIAMLRHPISRAYSAYWYARKQGWEELKTFEKAIEAERSNSSAGWNSSYPRDYLFHSFYCGAVERLTKAFAEEQIHVFLTDDLKTDSKALFESVLGFIGLQPGNLAVNRYNEVSKPRHEWLARLYAKIVYLPNRPLKRFLGMFISKKRADYVKKAFVDWNREPFTPPVMDSQTRSSLTAYFQQENETLGRLLKRDLTIWNLQQ